MSSYVQASKISGAFVPNADNPFAGQRWPYSPCILDVRHNGTIDVDYIVYLSGDHGTASGISVYFVLGDINNPANWKNRADAITAGWLTWLGASVPASDVILDYTPASAQFQTPEVIQNGDTFYLFGHVNTAAALGDPIGQQTIVYTSTDAINFTLYEVGGSPYLPLQDAVEHSGYLNITRNADPITGEKLFPGVDFQWVGVSSWDDDATHDVTAMWGANSLVPAAGWTRTAKFGKFTHDRTLAGMTLTPSATYSIGLALVSMRSLRRINGRTVGLGVIRSSPGDGSGARYGRIVEFWFSDDGRRITRTPQEVLLYGDAGADDKSIDLFDVLWLSDTTAFCVYTANAITGGDINNASTNSLRGASLAFHENVVEKADFTRLTALPPWLTTIGSESLAFDSDGMHLPAPALNAWFWFITAEAYNPDVYDYLELRINVKTSGVFSRVLLSCFSHQEPTTSSPPDNMHRIISSSGSGGFLDIVNKVGGVDGTATDGVVEVGHNNQEMLRFHNFGHRLDQEHDDHTVTIEGGYPTTALGAVGVDETLLALGDQKAAVGFRPTSTPPGGSEFVIESIELFAVHAEDDTILNTTSDNDDIAAIKAAVDAIGAGTTVIRANSATGDALAVSSEQDAQTVFIESIKSDTGTTLPSTINALAAVTAPDYMLRTIVDNEDATKWAQYYNRTDDPETDSWVFRVKFNASGARLAVEVAP